jgi:hypothetical protein
MHYRWTVVTTFCGTLSLSGIHVLEYLHCY